jgi:hypothetical protein
MDNDIVLENKLNNIKNKNEEKIFILENKFDTLENEFNTLMNKYKINVYKEKNEYNGSTDLLTLEKAINDYLINERENSLNNVGYIFNEIIQKINQKNIIQDDKNIIKIIIINIQNEFKEKYKQIIKQNDNLDFQNKEINNRIKTQIVEQFENVNNRIIKELLINNDIKNKVINYTQNYLQEIKKQMKLEKIQR